MKVCGMLLLSFVVREQCCSTEKLSNQIKFVLFCVHLIRRRSLNVIQSDI